jgi:hypothetical protein
MTTIPQKMQALSLANERRIGAAEFKRETSVLGTRGAARRVALVLEAQEDDPVMGSAKIRHLLTCVPNLGQKKAGKLLAAVHAQNGDKRLRDLTYRQRVGLALMLRTWAERWSS